MGTTPETPSPTWVMGSITNSELGFVDAAAVMPLTTINISSFIPEDAPPPIGLPANNCCYKCAPVDCEIERYKKTICACETGKTRIKNLMMMIYGKWTHTFLYPGSSGDYSTSEAPVMYIGFNVEDLDASQKIARWASKFTPGDDNGPCHDAYPHEARRRVIAKRNRLFINESDAEGLVIYYKIHAGVYIDPIFGTVNESKQYPNDALEPEVACDITQIGNDIDLSGFTKYVEGDNNDNRNSHYFNHFKRYRKYREENEEPFVVGIRLTDLGTVPIPPGEELEETGGPAVIQDPFVNGSEYTLELLFVYNTPKPIYSEVDCAFQTSTEVGTNCGLIQAQCEKVMVGVTYADRFALPFKYKREAHYVTHAIDATVGETLIQGSMIARAAWSPFDPALGFNFWYAPPDHKAVANAYNPFNDKCARGDDDFSSIRERLVLNKNSWSYHLRDINARQQAESCKKYWLNAPRVAVAEWNADFSMDSILDYGTPTENRRYNQKLDTFSYDSLVICLLIIGSGNNDSSPTPLYYLERDALDHRPPLGNDSMPILSCEFEATSQDAYNCYGALPGVNWAGTPFDKPALGDGDGVNKYYQRHFYDMPWMCWDSNKSPSQSNEDCLSEFCSAPWVFFGQQYGPYDNIAVPEFEGAAMSYCEQNSLAEPENSSSSFTTASTNSSNTETSNQSSVTLSFDTNNESSVSFSSNSKSSASSKSTASTQSSSSSLDERFNYAINIILLDKKRKFDPAEYYPSGVVNPPVALPDEHRSCFSPIAEWPYDTAALPCASQNCSDIDPSANLAEKDLPNLRYYTKSCCVCNAGIVSDTFVDGLGPFPYDYRLPGVVINPGNAVGLFYGFFPDYDDY